MLNKHEQCLLKKKRKKGKTIFQGSSRSQSSKERLIFPSQSIRGNMRSLALFKLMLEPPQQLMRHAPCFKCVEVDTSRYPLVLFSLLSRSCWLLDEKQASARLDTKHLCKPMVPYLEYSQVLHSMRQVLVRPSQYPPITTWTIKRLNMTRPPPLVILRSFPWK